MKIFFKCYVISRCFTFSLIPEKYQFIAIFFQGSVHGLYYLLRATDDGYHVLGYPWNREVSSFIANAF